MPGILQSPLLDRIGGSTRVRDNLAHALEVGRKVTAKVQWLSKTEPKRRARWMHCTPLLGVSDVVGVWMVILVDDESKEEIEVAPRMTSPPTHSLGSNYTAEALPWDARIHRTNVTGVSTTIWSAANEPKATKNTSLENPKNKPKKQLVRQPSDTSEKIQSQVTVRPGPKIAGKAYSFTSSNDGQFMTDDKSSCEDGRSRPASSSSNITPIQDTMQPKVRIAGCPSMEADSSRKPSMNVPYRPSADAREEGLNALPARRTYKSLSPYGILFQD